MSNTSITPVQISDTFQVWVNKTNEIVELINENVMLAGPAGFTVQGNSTLVGTFTANMLESTSGSIDNLSVITLQRSVDADEQIISSSPMRIETSVNNIFDLQTSPGNRPIFRMINGGNARWALGHRTNASGAAFGIGTEGAATPQVSITQAGRLTATELQGDGSLITNISAGNVASGTLNVARIPNLDASKITSGTFASNRISDLDASKITTGTLKFDRIQNLPASKTTSGTFAVARIPNLNASKISSGTLDVDRIPSLDASKIATGTVADARLPSNIVRDTRRIIEGTGIIVSGNGNLSADRTVSIVQLTQAQVSNPTNNTFGGVSGQRLGQAISNNTDAVLAATSNATAGGVGTYAFLSNVGGNASNPGEVESGSNLRYFGIRDTQVNAAGNIRGNAPAGSWRCMGFLGTAVSNGGNSAGTLWLRIS